jgi:Single-strand binding protein family
MTNQIFLSGKVLGNPEVSLTARGRTMVKILLEIEQMRPVGRGEYKMELHEIPVLSFSWCAEELKNVRTGALVTLLCHLSGTKYTPPGGELRYGVQLIVDSVNYPAPYRAPVKELANE